MQMRRQTELTAEEYVRTEAWLSITADHCPIHPDSNCRITRHGTYPREIPKGAQIVRYLCHTEKITFSLLPDCFSSRLPGTLDDVERVVLTIETAVRNSGHDELTMATAKKALASPDLAMPAEEASVGYGWLFEADIRWLMRRVGYVVAILSAAAGFFPESFGNCRPTLASFRSVLGDAPILIRLRAVAGSKIHEIKPPVGLNPRFSRPQDMARRPP